jgi:ATP-dependent DNA helicase RecG
MIVSLDNSTPTVLGLLAIGKSPQDYLPGAIIQFLRIEGTELPDPVIDEEEIGGPIVQMLRRIEGKIASHNRISVDITSAPTDIRKQDYPPPALHQLIYNAVLHRVYEGTNAPVRVYWFEDRIEISSPGGPFGNVTVENFGKPGITDYRNPNLAEVMKNFGFIQAFGRGIPTARRELEKNGNPPLEFEVNQSTVLFIVRRRT